MNENMPIGLKNHGNTCFLNSILQALTFCDPLVEEIKLSLHSLKCNKKHINDNINNNNYNNNDDNENASSSCVLCLLESHIKRVKYMTKNMGREHNVYIRSISSISPLNIVKTLPLISQTLQRGRQEDAHEFLRCLIAACQTSTKNDDYENEAKRLQSYPFSLFSGSLCSKVECQKCCNLSIKNDPVEDLELEIANSTSLESALADFCRKEILTDDNAYSCEKCNCKTTAYRQILLGQIPNVLSIQLKRFCYSYKERPRKLNHFVEYPEYLQLNSFIYKKSNNNGISTRGKKTFKSSINDNNDILRLFSVIVHLGTNIGNGHYISYIRSGEKWYRTSDEKVNLCTLQEALSQNAYLLFYSKFKYTPPSSNNEIVNNSKSNRIYNINKSIVNNSPEFDNRHKRKFILRSRRIDQSRKNHLKNINETDNDKDHEINNSSLIMKNKKNKRKIITNKAEKVIENSNYSDVTSNEEEDDGDDDDDEEDNDNGDYMRSKRIKLDNIIEPSNNEKDITIPTSYFINDWISSALNIKKFGSKVKKNVRNVFGFKKKKIINPNVISPMPKFEKNDENINKNRNISFDTTNLDNDNLKSPVNYFVRNINSFFNFLLFEKK